MHVLGILLNLSHIHLNSALDLYYISLLQVCSARHPPSELRKQGETGRSPRSGPAPLSTLFLESSPQSFEAGHLLFVGVKTLRSSEVKWPAQCYVAGGTRVGTHRHLSASLSRWLLPRSLSSQAFTAPVVAIDSSISSDTEAT